MNYEDVTPSQKAIVTARLPKLLKGSNQYGQKVEYDSVVHLSLSARAAQAGVSKDYQQRADYIL